jgi:hypothetical protein
LISVLLRSKRKEKQSLREKEKLLERKYAMLKLQETNQLMEVSKYAMLQPQETNQLIEVSKYARRRASLWRSVVSYT